MEEEENLMDMSIEERSKAVGNLSSMDQILRAKELEAQRRRREIEKQR